MSTENTIIPVALANTAEAERAAFVNTLQQPAIADLIMCIEDDQPVHSMLNELVSLPEQDAHGAAYILERIEEATNDALSVVSKLNEIAAAYRGELGLQAAIEAVVEDLQTSRTMVKAMALRRGLDLMNDSDDVLPRRLHDGLIEIGMPRRSNGRKLPTYRMASTGNWIRQLVEDLSGATEANEQVHAMKGTAG